MPKRRLRIAQLAPLVERVPPTKYGGTERIVSVLTEALVTRGHEVTLFAAGNSATSANLASVYGRSLREARVNGVPADELTLSNVGAVYVRQQEFDIVHDHTGPLSLPTAQLATTPVVCTLHGGFTPTNRRLYQQFDRPNYVAISHSQARQATDRIRIAATIYHGLDVSLHPYGEATGDYLLFVGRFSREKGAHHAIEVAQALDLPLVLAAKLDPVDMKYFRESIEPKLDGDRIRWVGEVDEAERNRLMAGARCLVNPLQWKEPFGLVMVEAMACGLPVVVFRNAGSVNELVRDGETGFLVESLDEMVDAVSRIGTIDRAACRHHVETTFSIERMVESYEVLYRSLVG